MFGRKYPIGKQDFPKLRNEGFVYVDKTKVQKATNGSSFAPLGFASQRVRTCNG